MHRLLYLREIMKKLCASDTADDYKRYVDADKEDTQDRVGQIFS